MDFVVWQLRVNWNLVKFVDDRLIRIHVVCQSKL